jgi:hypothetical protein
VTTPAALLADPAFAQAFMNGEAEAVQRYTEAVKAERQEAADAELAQQADEMRAQLRRRQAEDTARQEREKAACQLEHCRLVEGPRRLKAVGAGLPRRKLRGRGARQRRRPGRRDGAPPPHRLPRAFRSRLVARAEAYLLLRTNLYAELGAPMTMRERRQTLAWFEHRREG